MKTVELTPAKFQYACHLLKLITNSAISFEEMERRLKKQGFTTKEIKSVMHGETV